MGLEFCSENKYVLPPGLKIGFHFCEFSCLGLKMGRENRIFSRENESGITYLALQKGGKK